MLNDKKIYSIIFVSFVISIIISFIFIKNYDQYEISTDDIENHAMIKGDIPSIWKNGEIIKKDLKDGKNYFLAGEEIHRSYLPPRLIALFSYIFDYELFENWDEKIINSDNKKIYYLFFQSILYYFILIIFFREIRKKFDLKICFFIICFLSVEPSLFLFHSSFHTESIFFSLQILMLCFLFNDTFSKTKFFFVGLLLGLMFLQKVLALFYLIPIYLFYFTKYKKRSYNPLIMITSSYLIVLLIVGYANYKRSVVFYFNPPAGKTTLHLYLPEVILMKATSISYEDAYNKKKSDEKKWLIENDINLKLEIDRFKYYDYLQNYTLNILIEYPITTLKFITWKTIQMGVLDPIYIYNFLDKENKKRPYYYLDESYRKINLPLRILYSIIIYSIVLYGFIKCRKKISFENHILLISSVILMYLLLGWVGNSRYAVPTLIYLSIYFGYGIKNIYKFGEFKK